ncbi:hypothetical protein L083_0721 [Actinoplanes sp. N902-109]|nr:hypothetical protein L083_0721 [Actinoplanes sp. N902-109]
MVAVVGCGAWLLTTGVPLESVLLVLLCLPLAGVAIARWVIDGSAAPDLSALLSHLARQEGAA